MTLSYMPVNLALNPIVVNVDAADPVGITTRSGLRYYLKLMVPESYLSNGFTQLVEFEGSEEPPKQVAGGKIFRGAFFEVQDQLDSLLKRTAPIFGQTGISVCDGLVTPYYVSTRIENNGALLSDVSFPVQYAMKAGVAERDFAAYKSTFFTDYIGAGQRFLTWDHDNKVVQPNQPEFLYWLSNCSPCPAGLAIKVQTQTIEDVFPLDTYTAGTLANITPMTTYCLAVGPAALGIPNRPGTVVSYSVWLEDSAGNALSERRTYKMDAEFRRNVRFIVYATSLGGYATICLTGAGQESVKVTRNISERNPDYSYSPQYSERVINDATGERQLVVNTGFLSASGRAYLQELVMTKEAYLVTDRAFLPLIPSTDSVLSSVDDEYLAGRQLTFNYANPERNFSKLPAVAVSVSARPTGWRPKSFACLLDANGKRTGRKAVTMIEKYYLDTGQRVVDVPIKANLPGGAGYIPPDFSLDCKNTPFVSAAISRSTTAVRSTCANGQIGGPAAIIIPAGSFGSELSQKDADAKAEAEFVRLNTQAYADANGTCIAAPESYTWAVPAGQWHYRTNRPTLVAISFRNPSYYPIWGNSYSTQGNGNPYGYAFGTNDMNFPTETNGTWNLTLYGLHRQVKKATVYRNGVVINTILATINQDGYEFTEFLPGGFSFGVGDTFYVRIDDV